MLGESFCRNAVYLFREARTFSSQDVYYFSQQCLFFKLHHEWGEWCANARVESCRKWGVSACRCCAHKWGNYFETMPFACFVADLTSSASALSNWTLEAGAARARAANSQTCGHSDFCVAPDSAKKCNSHLRRRKQLHAVRAQTLTFMYFSLYCVYEGSPSRWLSQLFISWHRGRRCCT